MLTHRKPMSFIPLGLVAILACVVFVSSLVLGAHHIDIAEQHREERQIGQDVGRRVKEISGRMNPFTLWDDALRQLEGRLNKTWADENIGSLTQNAFYPRVLILDRNNRPVYVKKTSGPATQSDSESLLALAAPAVAEVRRREAARIAPPLNTPVRVNVIGLVEGQPALAIAALVRTDTGKVKSLYPRTPILVIQVSLERNLRETFASRFMLSDLRIQTVRQRPDAGRAEADLAKLPDGQRIILTWTPQKPGAELLTSSVLFLVIAALGVAIAGAAVVLHASRITRELVASQTEARRLALEDPLTGLANRLLFADRLQQAGEELKRGDRVFGLLCLDLDRFKDVNDTLGHEAGDALIKEVSRRLKLVCRAEDAVARLGGDEFAVLARVAGSAGVGDLAGRVVAALSGLVDLAAAQVTLSCSVGVTILVDPEITPTEALQQADLALYRAKERGRGQFCCFEPEMDVRMKSRKSLESDLREAIEADAITVAYQPLVDGEARMSGVEAIERWTHPIRGDVASNVFIPIAEASGLINPLADALFRRICLDARGWDSLPIALNVSPVQLRLPGLPERLVATLEATGLPAARFDLEFDTSVLQNDEATVHETLANLREIGFGIVLSGFGTGNSSIFCLDKLPIQKIKLEPRLVRRVSSSPKSRAIVTALLQMADALQIHAVAEGIETAAEHKMLRDLGCREFQGAFFSHPTTAQAIDRLFKDLGREPLKALPAR